MHHVITFLFHTFIDYKLFFIYVKRTYQYKLSVKNDYMSKTASTNMSLLGRYRTEMTSPVSSSILHTECLTQANAHRAAARCRRRSDIPDSLMTFLILEILTYHLIVLITNFNLVSFCFNFSICSFM